MINGMYNVLNQLKNECTLILAYHMPAVPHEHYTCTVRNTFEWCTALVLHTNVNIVYLIEDIYNASFVHRSPIDEVKVKPQCCSRSQIASFSFALHCRYGRVGGCALERAGRTRGQLRARSRSRTR